MWLTGLKAPANLTYKLLLLSLSDSDSIQHNLPVLVVLTMGVRGRERQKETKVGIVEHKHVRQKLSLFLK